MNIYIYMYIYIYIILLGINPKGRGPDSVQKILYRIRPPKKKLYKIRTPNQNSTVQNQDPQGTVWDQF